MSSPEVPVQEQAAFSGLMEGLGVFGLYLIVGAVAFAIAIVQRVIKRNSAAKLSPEVVRAAVLVVVFVVAVAIGLEVWDAPSTARYATCVAEQIEKAQNEQAARLIAASCRKASGEALDAVGAGDLDGDFSSKADCLSFASTLRVANATTLMAGVCGRAFPPRLVPVPDSTPVLPIEQPASVVNRALSAPTPTAVENPSPPMLSVGARQCDEQFHRAVQSIRSDVPLGTFVKQRDRLAEQRDRCVAKSG